MDRVVAYLMSELFTATSRETTDALTSPRATSRSDDRKRREPRTKSHRGSEPLRFHANDSSRDLTPSGSFMHARSGPLLMEKAQEISKKLNVKCDASFSSGWLHKFKLRHGITGKTVSVDVDCETVDDWIENQLPDLIKGYEQKDVFNADETGLFYNLLPSKTLAIKWDTCHGGKKMDVNPIENAESDHFVPAENWSNLSDVTAFEEFVQCDSELATCSLLTIDEMITNEETSSEEEDNCAEKPLPSFQQALTGFNTMQGYLISSDLNDKVKMALLTVHNELFSVHSKNALQPKITKCILQMLNEYE
ncbi:hypothetical protein AVEN_91353-1 [Araneus ventricosus]|uniref:HTH CENPB-type domain-containing protein n=1 Tax=Araneus ventricosus TaxID=182803 RepID=A0A4Y2PR44_ARAVE|nr:hypothetical protein AVEN_85143-1 [Araneus ventricosus]GBN52718.1 hypothetical protein AVEN_91353-1 [Araneus ventricosus]